MTSAAEWFKRFIEELPNDDGVRIQRELFDERGTWGTETQWTHVMSVFLMKLARKMGYFQECTNIDFIWYKGDSINPSILIEHEHDYKTVAKSEVPKLLRRYKKKRELIILITYTWTSKKASADEIKQIRDKILENISTKIRELKETWTGEFLLIIGDSSPAEEDIDWSTYWHGYVFDQFKFHKVVV